MGKYILRVLRGQPGHQYFEEFELEAVSGENVISALMRIQRNPVNRRGENVEPVTFESGCLEEVCGSCSMLVNGRPRQACTALIHQNLEEGVLTLAPFTKFPLVRDLMVDRSQMFENLKRVHAWIDVDNSLDSGPGPKITPEKQHLMYQLSTCMTCGCCSESCPNVSDKSAFVGPAPISTVRFMNEHPTGATQKAKRLHPLMEEGGITGCGNAQNCVKVCPKKIPLTESISAIGRSTTLQALSDLFSVPGS